MAGSYWSSQHCKAAAEVNAVLRARELKHPSMHGDGSIVSRLNSSCWCVVVCRACIHVACLPLPLFSPVHILPCSISANDRRLVLRFFRHVVELLQLSKTEVFHTFDFDHVIGTACVYVHRFCCATKKLRYALEILAVSCFCLSVKVEEVPQLSNSMILRVIPPSVQRFFPSAASNPEIATGDIEKMEAVLMQQLDFELIVHHPFRIVADVASATGSSHVLSEAMCILNDSYAPRF